MFNHHLSQEAFQKKLDVLQRVCKARYQKRRFRLPIYYGGEVTQYYFRVKDMVVCAHAGVQQPWLLLCVGHKKGEGRHWKESDLASYIDRELGVYLGIKDATSEVFDNLRDYKSRLRWMVQHNNAMSKTVFVFPSEYPLPVIDQKIDIQNRRRSSRR